MKVTPRQLRDAIPSISVGILTADLLRLESELAILEQAGANVVHIDVMDGVFCPELTVGPPVIKAIPDSFIKDCHLMIEDPIPKVDAYVAAGAGIITCHVESTRHPHRLLQSLSGSGVIRGIAVNPGTPLEVLVPLIDDLDLILLLAVNPGWRAQPFLSGTERRVAETRKLIGNRDVILGVDGGVTKSNIEHVASLGADLIVSGSAIYDGAAAAANARFMMDKVRQSRPSTGSVEADPAR
jgi:ribulose-phosphate 3-epimerase